MSAKNNEETTDILVVGAGHNGLVSAILMAREGHKVTIVEEKGVVGGCVRTEYPFTKTAPKLAQSTGAYLLGVMPPELMKKLGLNLPLIRRDPHYFLPTDGKGYILFGSNQEEVKRQYINFFSEQDWNAYQKLEAELEAFRQDVGHTWLMEPLSIEETAEKFVRPELRQVFIDLCRKPISHYLKRFGFKSELLMAMYAVTDAFSGLNAGWDTPGTGMNFLIHNMCRLQGSDGTWMIVKGGMGTITKTLAEMAQKLGVRIILNNGVRRLIVSGQGNDKVVRGAVLQNGQTIRANVVVVNADPFRMREITGAENFPQEYNARLDNYKRDGTTLKVNMSLKGLPKFKCLSSVNVGPYGTTTHILPQGSNIIQKIQDAYQEVKEGKLPQFPTIEWYVHSTVDQTISDGKHHSSALFVQWVPYELKGTTWEKEEAKYVKHLLSILDQFAPGTSDLVTETFVLTPPKLEKHFGISRGHIHHIDNTFGFADRLPYQTPVKGLYSCSAGTHPAGSVIGCAGHNAAMRVVKDIAEKKISTSPIAKL